MRRGYIHSLNAFKFGVFIGRFPSDGVASMAGKGLNLSGSNAAGTHRKEKCPLAA